MKNKLTKSQLKKYRKKLKTSDVLERNLLNAFRKVFSFKKQDLITINELADQAQSFNYTGIARYIQRIAQDIVNRNNTGFVDVVKSLITGSKGMDSTRQKELNKALQDTIKQRKIYAPLMRKFEENVSLIKNIPMDVIQELRNKYAAGVSFRGTDIEQYLTKRLGNRARLIIRTESSKLNAALTEVRARNLGISAFIWSTSEDRRVRPSHKMMDGVVVFYGNILSLDKMIGYAGEYPNCFPGDELVNLGYGVHKLYRRKYEGPLVTVILDNGTSITATPNHPFLSGVKWRSLNDFNVGDELFEVRQTGPDFVSMQYDSDESKPTFEQLFTTLSIFQNSTFTITGNSKSEFHGDGIINKDVDIIDIESLLSNNLIPLTLEVFREFDLEVTGDTVSTALFPHECPMASFRVGVDSSSNCGMCRNCILNIVLRRASGHHDSISSCIITEFNSVFLKNSFNNLPVSIKFNCDSWSPYTLLVTLDYLIRRKLMIECIGGNSSLACFTGDETTLFKSCANSFSVRTKNNSDFSKGFPFVIKGHRIVKKFVTQSSTHVYNLQSDCGYYTIKNNICQHNCRCVSLPLVTLEDIKFPVKVAVGDLYIETRKNKAVIVSGQIRTFTKQQFIQQYGKYFPNEL